MKKGLLFLTLLIAISINALAQKPLTNSRTGSVYTYVYRLDETALALFYAGKLPLIIDKILTTPIDSFLANKPKTIKLPTGNYLKVTARENKLQYELVEQHTAYLHLLEDQRDIQFVLMDGQGSEITDAQVFSNNKQISYDAAAHRYLTGKSKKDTLLRVNYQGVSNYYKLKDDQYKSYRTPHYSLSKKLQMRWRRVKNNVAKLFAKKSRKNLRYNDPATYPGYIVFNKPKYRPGDTVKFKAFILKKGSKKPIDDQRLIVRLKDDRWDNGKVIGYVDAYRKGGFEYQFKLVDSMDLRLDNEYYIGLESLSSAKYDLDKYDGDMDDEEYLSKRTLYQQGKFEYEDYELKTNKFTVRADKTEHAPGQPASLYFRAVDDNGLDVPDGRVTVVLRTNYVTNEKGGHVFVPDTLWKHQMPLEQVGETKLTIPDSIFPHARIEYSADVTLLNSNNERRSESRSLTFTDRSRQIQSKLDADTLKISHYINGKAAPVQAVIFKISAGGDTLERLTANLPAALIIDQTAARYKVVTDSLTEEIDAAKFKDMLAGSNYRTADSLFVTVSNPRKVKFWYTIFYGDRVLERGINMPDNYRLAVKGKKSISVLFNMIWAGKAKYDEMRAPYQDKYLSINISQPVTVYPGQEATIKINVQNDKGQPVPNTDLTAYSITRKFENYTAPNLPYLGKIYPDRKMGKRLYTDALATTGQMKLNWQRWSKQMGLDSIEYYKFTHPDTVYTMAEANPDSTTQIAPFVVKDGDIIPVHILYVDGIPVYFSKTDDLKRYSFAVKPGVHDLRFRTQSQNIRLDNVRVPDGKKFILSLNADSLNKRASFTKMTDTLTTYEADLINKYLIYIVPTFGDRMATISKNDNIYLLNGNMAQASYSGYRNYNRQQMIATGPIAENVITYKVQGEEARYVHTEPGYSFEFEPGLIKQKSLPVKYPFERSLFNVAGTTDHRQYALTSKAVDSIWQNYLDLRSNTTQIFNQPYRDPNGKGQLTVNLGRLSNGQIPFIKNVIVNKYDDPDFMDIYPGNRTYLGYYAPGRYRILYLLKGNSYYLQENVVVKANGRNFYHTGVFAAHAKDATSLKIAAIIEGHSRSDGRVTAGDVQLIKETFNEKYLDVASLTGEMAGYVYGKDDGLPLPGVAVKIRGSAMGTTTDIRGFLRIKVPGTGKLVIIYIGYETQDVSISPGTTVKVSLNPSSRSLNEVVVVGYGAVNKQSVTGALTSVTMGLAGKAAGINLVIRGNSTISGTGKPLVVVDGIIYDGDLATLDPSLIGSIDILKDAAATAIYGTKAGNGVILVSTKKKGGLPGADDSNPAQRQTMRKNFNDAAYWQPKLVTDEQGNASFKTTFPDDITNWRTFVIGMTGNKQSGFAEGQIKAYKPLSANLTTPLFAVKGDEFSAIGKVLNYTTDTIRLKRAFKFKGELLKEGDLLVKNSLIDTFRVTAAGKDSLQLEYTIKRPNGYFDGEQRSIPLFEQGTLETKGTFAALDKDSTITIQLDPKLKEGTFRAEASVLPALLEETEHLRDYEYLCNEQLASKLKALLSEKRIRTYLGEPFKYDKNVNEIIKKLQENRRQQGTWGWWKDTDEELWISLHAAEALLDAEAQGFKAMLDKQRLIDYLQYQATSYKGENKLTVLLLLRKLGAKADYAAIIDAYVKSIDPVIKTNLYDKLRLLLVRQQQGQPIVMDSLMKHMKQTMFGNVYWGNDTYYFFDNAVQASILAYQILKLEGKHPDLLSKLRNYFLEQRKTGYWRNTYESALILETILPDLLINGKKPAPSVITLSGDRNETVTKFPYSTTLSGGANLVVKKTGTMPVYITAYQKFWNPQPEKVSKDFIVNTTFAKNGQALTSVKGGEPITLTADVTTRADADFVMVEIPIPAGCSYQSKEQGYGYNEVHREYFKNKVSIFCRKLKAGKHTFTVKLVPRYGGTYHVNPAKAELMYFPVFYGRESMKVFSIE